MITWHCPAAGHEPGQPVQVGGIVEHHQAPVPVRLQPVPDRLPEAVQVRVRARPRPGPRPTSASPFSTLAVSPALTHATSRQPASIQDRAYAAATCVLPTPRIPVTARTTVTPGPLCAQPGHQLGARLECRRPLRHLPDHHRPGAGTLAAAGVRYKSG